MKIFGNGGFEPEERITRSHQHKQEIERYSCPQCTKNELQVLVLEEGRKHWEARVRCRNCGTAGIINNLGFHMDFATRSEKK